MPARIRVPSSGELASDAAALASEWERLGSDTAFVRALGYRGDLVPTFFEFYTALRADGLVDAKLKELVRLRIAQLNRCGY